MDEVNSYIINTDPYKKHIELKIHLNTYLLDMGMAFKAKIIINI